MPYRVPRKPETNEKLREIEDQLAKANYIPDKKIPIFSKVAENWLRHKKPNLRESTWSVYERHTKKHFQEFDSLKINRITTAAVEKFITDRLNQGMNISTLRKILVSLGQIFSYAVRHGYIHYNPLPDAERPRGKGEKSETVNRVLSPTEINKFLKKVKDQKFKTLFMLAIMSGARQGELLGLKWFDIDWKNNQVHIQRTFNNAKWYDVKTKTSNRKVDLGPKMMAELKKWKIACPPNKLNLIFPNKSGRPINHNNLIHRYFYPALGKAKLPRIRFHDLRHTYASLKIEQGANIKYIQTQLGHSSPTVTLNVYAHLMKPTNPESAKGLENMVFG